MLLNGLQELGDDKVVVAWQVEVLDRSAAAADGADQKIRKGKPFRRMTPR